MNKITTEQLEEMIQQKENKNLEFKSKRNSFSDKDRSDYCAAIANSGGGKLLLGVNDSGKIIGTSVYKGNINKIPQQIYQNLEINVDVSEISHPQGRVVIFEIPSRPLGRLIKSDGRYLTRRGESLVDMSDEEIKSILNEVEADYTSEAVDGLTINKDLDKNAIRILKNKINGKSGNKYQNYTTEELLKTCGLYRNKKLTKAALILLGTANSLREYLPCSEIIFEWRQSEKVTHDFRKEWRNAFLLTFEDVWNTINDRNIRFPFQEGFIQREIWAFNEKVIRESVLNAVCHRDYRVVGGSIFIKALPNRFSITSPGGFPSGVTAENALEKQIARNRSLAEVFQRIGLVERAGQGLDDIFRSCIEEGKGTPDFIGTDNYQVNFNVPALLQDTNFVQFLEKVINNKQKHLSLDELLELEQIRKNEKKQNPIFKSKLSRLGVIEKVGYGRGTTYILSKQYYEHINQTGIHTKLKGLSRDQKKQLILNHLKENKRGYSKDIQVALDMNQADVNNLLQELKKENKVKHIGHNRWGYWQVY